MIKAVLIDFDSTLYSHNTKSVPESAKEGIRRLKENGIIVILATGRHDRELEILPIREFEFDAYITTNGQLCYNDDEYIYTASIHPEDIRHILSICDGNKYPTLVFERDEMYIKHRNERADMIHEIITIPMPHSREYDGKAEIYQIMTYVDDSQQADIIDGLRHSKINRWHEYGIDILPMEGGKENAAKAVCDYYSLKPEEIMAVGDGTNDIGLLKLVGIGVAMGNAKDATKEASDYVTDDIDDNGLYNALEHFGLI